MCLFAFCISSGSVFKCFIHFVWLSFSYYWVFRVLHISGYKSFMRSVIFKYFLLVCGLCFHYLRAEILNFDEIQDPFFTDHAVGVLSKKSFPHKITKVFSCVFFWKFCSLAFTFWSVILFNLTFVWDKDGVFFFFFF